ncbi:MAG TPA: ATP-binding protein [Acidobacteriaceae bacterium]
MLPSSHAVPIKTVAQDSLHSPKLLADAFSEFISASSLLEDSYRDLQGEVAHLGLELAERNAALTRSLAENDHMRAGLQQIINSMPCGVLVLDTDEQIVTINPEGRALLQLGSEEVADLRDICSVSRINFESMVQESDHEISHELCIGCSSGKRWLAISKRRLTFVPASRTPGSQRRSLHSIWIFRDVTATKQAEQEREAARSAMALAEISAILAHEIRNPLASMELFAGLIAEDSEDSGQAAQWVSHLRAGIRLLSATVNNVLSIHGGSNSHLVPIDLTACMQNGVDFVRPIAEQAGIKLSFAVAEEPLKIQGNENLLRQIILNLICNAIRHTPTGGKVDVSTRAVVREGTIRAVVDVADAGCGIPAHLLGHVFDTGFSANGDTPGLGLAVCRRLMTSHGGEIRVTSHVNCGSTFELEFPAL